MNRKIKNAIIYVTITLTIYKSFGSMPDEILGRIFF
jgi:hypothetical protein